VAQRTFSDVGSTLKTVVGRLVITIGLAQCVEIREVGEGVLGRQANLMESSKSKELAEMSLQVLVVVIKSDACESKKESMRLRE
jgi:hypothetical protein